MIIIKGKSVFKAIAIGKLAFYKRGKQQIKRYHIDSVQDEIKRFQKARDSAVSELKKLYDKALKEVGEASALIFEIHQMMLLDDDYNESIENIIKTQNINAEFAIGTTSDNFSQMFASMEDSYMRERAHDIKDISDRVLNKLLGVEFDFINSKEPVIIAADDLAPSETVQLDKSKVLGFITLYGSSNSHTAILARSMNIASVINANGILNDSYAGKMTIIDGFTGNIYIEPDDATLSRLSAKKALEEEKIRLLENYKGKPNITIDGKKIEIYANIGNISDMAAVLKNDAGGIGLFRSEFIYLESKTYPTENEQFSIYKTAAENMAGKKTIIRTLDIGADKKINYFNLPHEENPALGYRAIRICLTRPEIFKTQLRAIFRASAFGNISIMFPMITSLCEIQKIKEIVKEVQNELETENIPFNKNTELGIMIETPAAALISDILAKEVDFFSIGTNDLTQYTLAMDRQNQKLEEFLNPYHTSILRLIKLVCDNGHKNGIWVGICGELGSDLNLTETLLSIGIDELSVSPPNILPLRKKVIETDISKIENKIF